MKPKPNTLENGYKINPLTPAELAGVIRHCADRIGQPVGLGVWEGKMIGHHIGNRLEGRLIGVFRNGALVAPFGPVLDEESKCCALLFAACIQFSATIAGALERTHK